MSIARLMLYCIASYTIQVSHSLLLIVIVFISSEKQAEREEKEKKKREAIELKGMCTSSTYTFDLN